VWFTPDGDGVALYHFDKRPDLPEDLRSDNGVRAFYERATAGSPAKVVEAVRTTAGGCRAVRMIVKSPQQPTGMTYVGSLTLPFRDFSYVLKVQCAERGTTGMREAVLFDRAMQAGTVRVEVPSQPGLIGRLLGKEKPAAGAPPRIIGDWSPDDPKWDARFPEHPISRVRRVLARVEGSLTVDATIRGAAPFGKW
jgi:hypothetical protein